MREALRRSRAEVKRKGSSFTVSGLMFVARQGFTDFFSNQSPESTPERKQTEEGKTSINHSGKRRKLLTKRALFKGHARQQASVAAA